MARRWRIAAYSTGALLLLAVALAAAVLIAGNTAGGRALIERATARLSGGHVRLAGLSGAFPAAIDLRQLQLADESGVWLSAERISLRWSPLALLARHVKVQRLQIGRLAIERRPVTHPTPTQANNTVPHLDLERLDIDTLELGPQLTRVRASLSVQGALHVVSLNDAAARLAARRTDGAGDYRLALRFDASRMDASVSLMEPAGGPLEQLLQFPGLGALSVAATLNGPRGAERLEASARMGEMQGFVRGTVDLPRGFAQLDYSMDAPAMTPRPGFSWQRIALHGSWDGTLAAARAQSRLRVERLQLPGGAGLATLVAELGAEPGVITARASAEGLVLPGPAPRLLADSPLRMSANARFGESSRPIRLSVEHRLFALDAHVVTADAPSATFDGYLKDLAPLAAIAGQELRGSARLKGSLRQSSGTTRVELAGTSAIAGDGTLLSRLLAGSSRLQLTAALSERTLDVERLTLDGSRLAVAASGSARRGKTGAESALRALRARYEARVSDLAVLSPAIGGTLSASGQLEGPVTSLATRLQLTSSLSVRGSRRETLKATVKADGLPSHASATVQAGGQLEDAPLQLDAAVTRNGADALHIAVRRAAWKSVRLEADLTTAADLTPGNGMLRLSIDRLEDLQPLVGTSVAGRLSGALTLRPLQGRTDTRVQLDATNLAAAGFAGDVRLTAMGPLEGMSVRLAVQTPNLGGERADLDAAARLNLTAHELGLQQARAHYHGQQLRLLAPARLSFADGLTVSRLQLGVQRAVMELNGRISPQLELRASVHRVDAAIVNAFLPGTLAQGKIDVDAQLHGSFSSPSGLVTARASGLRSAWGAAQDLDAVDVQASARLAGAAAQLDARVDAGRASRLTLAGTAPLDPGAPLNLRLSGKIDAAFVNPLLEARGERAAGVFTVDATVAGTMRSPEIGGTLDLAHGDVRDYVRGVHLSDIAAHLVGSAGTLRVESLSARAAPGQVSMTGTIGLLQPKLPISLQLKAGNAQPIASDILTTTLDADLKVAGTLRERIDVSGNIGLHRTVIGIPNALPPDVAVLDVRRPGQAPPAPPEQQLVIGLDVRLHAPREILVQGRGLNAELGGDLRIRGTTNAPAVSGGFDLIRGTFALASTQLTFSSGRVSFNGAGLKGKIDPTLDFTAQTTTGDGTTATLHVGGLADTPQFELSSTPPLPQDEILARLLFGESADKLTALQIAQIGAALASLSGVGGSGPNPLAKVQKKLGLDRLSVSGGSSSGAQGTQSSGASVEAGRYVSNRVFVGARQSTTGFSQLEVDVDLSKHLKVQSRLGNGSATTQGITPENDPGSSIGMVYQFEY